MCKSKKLFPLLYFFFSFLIGWKLKIKCKVLKWREESDFGALMKFVQV